MEAGKNVMGCLLVFVLKPKAESSIVTIFIFFVRLKIDALAVDSFTALMPKVQAGNRKIGVILLRSKGNYLPFYD
jgi:hypothetical protein